MPIEPREQFWNVEWTGLFYALSAAAVALLVFGLVGLVRRWRGGWMPPRPAPRDRWLADVFLNAGVFAGDPLGGLAHLLTLWGFLVLFLGTVLLTIDHYLVTFLTGTTWLVYSLVLDLFGAAFVLAVLWLLVRRHVLRRKRMHRKEPEDSFLLVLLLVIALSGFVTEGFRFAAEPPPRGDWSPVGALFSHLAPAGAASAHRIAWWTHAILSLLLVGWLPWGKLRHALTSPLHRVNAAATPVYRTAEEREEQGAPFGVLELLSTDACMWCNRCETACPSDAVGEALSPRQVVADLERASLLGADRTTASPYEVPWLCTSCGACRQACPISIDGRDLIRETRALLVEAGTNVPGALAKALESLAKRGNPWEGMRSKRSVWAEGLALPDYTGGMSAKSLWFVGCTLAYDTRCQQVARATAQVFQAARLDFAVAGKKETCSGDLARRVGEDGLFEMLLEENVAIFSECGAERLVVSSPHDLHALSVAYPKILPLLEGVKGNVPPAAHVTEVLAERLREGALRFGEGPARTVTFHDPCYLGRHRGTFDAPRELLRAMPGLSLVEMEENREHAACCGGGGGRMWFEPETAGKMKMSERRIRQAHATGADIVATACPYCLIQFEDAVKTTGLEGELRVADIVELAAEVMKP